MNLLNFKFFLILSAYLCVGCSTQPKKSEDVPRQPQNSVYEESEIYTDDTGPSDGLELEDAGPENKKSSLFSKICTESKSKDLKVNDRVVTINDGHFIAGNIKKTYQSENTLIVSTDYGINTNSRKRLQLTRTFDKVSKALDCIGTKAKEKKVYGLFKVENKYYTGHVREVFKNGVVRFVNDRFQEQFTTVDQSFLETLGSKLKLKSVLFTSKNEKIEGQIRRVFEKDILLVKSGNKLFLRNLAEVMVQD